MRDLWNLLPASGWERLAVDAVWQSTGIAAVALVAAWLVRRRPALRAAILLSAAALSLAVPLLSTAVRWSGGGLLSPPDRGGNWTLLVDRAVRVADRPGATFMIPADAITETRIDAGPAKAKPITAGWAFRSWPWLAGCWLVASGFLTLRLLRGVVAVRRWIKMATPCHDRKIESALARAAEAIGARRPELLWSPAFDSPALVVLGRARLLLPAEMPADVDWFAIFCHELAHRARRDDLSRLVVELAMITLPWQPLLWVVRRRFRAACEEACDDWAVAAGADPVEFASLLVALVPERRPAFALGMAESASATRHRILRLLAMQGAVHPRLGMLLGAAGCVAAVALAITLALLQFNSRARLSDPIGRERDWAPDRAPGTPRGTAADAKAIPATEGNRPAGPPWGLTPLPTAVARAAGALPKNAGRPAPYVIEPPDILLIDAVKLVPKSPYHIEPLDVLKVLVANPLIEQPISGPYPVDTEGAIDLGPAYGKVLVAGQTVDEARKTVETHLKTVLPDPQVSLSLSQTDGQQQIAGEHLVGPDGTVNVGTYGTVYVAGLTIAEAKAAVEAQLSNYLEQPRVSVDVFSYNSKVYYVITRGAGGDTIVRVPITGNETVLDALAQQPGGIIPNPNDCWVWVARSASRPATAEPQRGAKGEPSTERDVFATADGVVDEVMVDHGDWVRQGQVLVRLHNPELQASAIDLQGKLSSTQKKMNDLRAALDQPSGDDEQRSHNEAELAEQQKLEISYKEQLKLLQKKIEQLAVTSPIDGQIETWHPSELLLHRPVRQGQVLMSIAASELVLPVDWKRVVEGTDTMSNWRIQPGDRIFVCQKPRR